MNWLLVWCKPQWRPYMYVPQLIWSLSAIIADISIAKLADYWFSPLLNLYCSTIDQLHVWINRWYPFIAELAERSPIIIQNRSNPSSQKNLDVRPYDCTTARPYNRTTVQPYNRTTVRPYKVLLLTCVVNCAAGTPTPRLCPVVQWSVHWAPSRTTQVLVLARARRCVLETCGKKMRKKKCELHL